MASLSHLLHDPWTNPRYREWICDTADGTANGTAGNRDYLAWDATLG